MREAASAGNFAAYMAGQGGANVPRDVQTVRVARKVADEPNAYDEEVQKVVGIFAPHLGAGHIHETRSTEWRIVRKAVDVDVNPLTLKSASGAPRSPVNNCGEVQTRLGQALPSMPSEYAMAVMKLVVSGNVGWDEPDVAKVLGEAARRQSPSVNYQQQSFDPSKSRELAPSTRLTKCERAKVPKIYRDLVSQGITPERWESEVLARGASVMLDDNHFSYPTIKEWTMFNNSFQKNN